ncbi:glycosyltransferase [Microlunatus flavus]|uniref:Methyltransferase domain-containing protein n=1 Tax=Microlunatus flavus TaxID=1036181 RepID=A0A1H9CWD2_9ACTN|nr:glycosyltransferase [Microlunatus flavus]SEQ05546.1 Methyltransferase domain-containing protein [Microlunatus flavus]
MDPAPTLVSVVMIFRDAERFFDAAIDSVLAQTHPALELLLCDDGSTDASTATARRRADAEPARVRYLDHPGHAHRGMSATRNLGIAAARGEVVAFLDADDVWDPGHLAHEVALLADHPEASFVCGRALDWYSWKDADAEDRWSPLPWPPGTSVPPPRMLSAVLRRGAYSTPTCSLLVRRDVLHEVGGGDDAFTALFEDQVLLAKLYLTQTCVISGTRTARYRRHDWSSTAVAQREGTYDPGGPSSSHEAFVRWLVERPELAVDDAEHRELRDQLAGALRPYDALPQPVSARERLRRVVPSPVRPLVRRGLRGLARRTPRPGLADVWPLRRLDPVSRQFGYDRGLPVDRYYIERFLAEHAQLVAGRVLEVGDDGYTRQFGGPRVSRSDVLNVDGTIAGTTLVADLGDLEASAHLPSEAFDCLVVTQTLHLVYDMAAAMSTLHRLLAPGGTLLLTVPGISPLSADRWAGTWSWALTPYSARRLVGEVFGDGEVQVTSYGNVLSAVSFLEGLAAGELRRRELDTVDPQFPVLVAVRADKPCAG